MPKLFSLIVMIAFLAACTLAAPAPQWHHRDNPDPLQLQRALSDCHMYLDAAQESGASPPHRRIQEWDTEFVQCMAERGWMPTQESR